MHLVKIKKTIYYCLFLLIFALLAAEIILRIYNPFPSSVVGDKIILTPNYNKVYYNKRLYPDVDDKIIYKRNSIGLRGPEPPVDFSNHLTIIAIGGSTTECTWITEGKTWEDHLSRKLNASFNRTWLNNAGLEGHSTFGHVVLMRDYIADLKPDICLFLIGCNDVGRRSPQQDLNFTKTGQNWILVLAKHSRLANVILSLYRNHLAKERHLVTRFRFILRERRVLHLSDSTIQKAVTIQKTFLGGYRQRLQELIRLCRTNKIEPVFITQPCLLGSGIDSLTGVDLATCDLAMGMNGKRYWEELELFNTQTKKIAADSGLLVIDLAHKLPKNSIYFYDAVHYNNEGSSKVAEIIAEELIPYLKQKYPQYQRKVNQ